MKLASIRQFLADNKIDAIIVGTADSHQVIIIKIKRNLPNAFCLERIRCRL